MINRKPSPIAQLALDYALSQVGNTECHIPGNGKCVREYNTAACIPNGHSWDTSFVYWCFKAAADKLTLPCPLMPAIGMSQQFISLHSRIAKKLGGADNEPVHPDNIRPGDIFIMQYKHGHRHCGIIEKITGDTVITVEGNIDDGKTGKIGVFSKRRKVSQIYALIRISD